MTTDVLDCSCGIGTQAIGLARKGYRVHATDISEQSVERARREAARLRQNVSFNVADFRDLDSIDGPFDVVISCDNAIPHLLDDHDIRVALRAMARKLRPGGLLVISIRDYDQALVDRPLLASRLIVGPPRRIILRFHDWASDGPVYTLHLFVVREAETGRTLSHHTTRYRALPREALTQAARREFGSLSAADNQLGDAAEVAPPHSARVSFCGYDRLDA